MSVKPFRKVLCLFCRLVPSISTIICISNFQMAEAPPHPVRPKTWCFALRLQMTDFSPAEEICDAIRSILNDAQQAILGLEGFSFLTVCQKAVSHMFADFCTPRTSTNKIAEASVQGWFSDARIPPETTRWTPVWPGKNSDWRQDNQIQAISAGCEDGSRQLKHCIKGSRPDAAWKGGRHRKTPVAPGEGDSAAAGGAGVKRGLPRNGAATHRRRRRVKTTSRWLCGSNSPK